MARAYAIVPMPLQNDLHKWIKVIVPLDVYDVVEKTQWCWNSIEKDAFFLLNKDYVSFRKMARLFGEQVYFDMNACSWNLMECDRLDLMGLD